MDIDEELICRLGEASCLALSPEERGHLVSDLSGMVGVLEGLARFVEADGRAETGEGPRRAVTEETRVSSRRA